MVYPFRILVADGGDVPVADRVLDLDWGRYLGKYESGFLGVANRELRVLGWDRSRWNADFGYLVLVPTKLANKH